MSGTAWLFPGQGSQFPGMGRGLWEGRGPARDLLEEAEDLAGLALREVALRGPRDRLRRPEVAEPFLAAVSLACVAILRERGASPAFVAGYSAGEVAALHCAGVVGRADALRIAVIRGRLLRAAAGATPGLMVAISGIPEAEVEAIVEDRAAGHVSVAARNGPDHVAISGDRAGVDLVLSRLAGRKAEVVPVDVDGPWHSRLLDRAAEEVFRELQSIPFDPPTIPILTSASGRVVADPPRLRVDHAAQLRAPVLWGSIVRVLHRRGVRSFVEVGPGRVLLGLHRHAWPGPEPCEIRHVMGRGGEVRRPEPQAESPAEAARGHLASSL